MSRNRYNSIVGFLALARKIRVGKIMVETVF